MMKSHIGLLTLFTSVVLTLSAQEERTPETSLNLGFNLTRGTQDTVLVELGGKSSRPIGEEDTLTVSASYAYGETETEPVNITTKDTSKTNLRYDKALNGPMFAFAEIEALRDSLSEIEYRSTTGPGVGTSLVESEAFTLNVEGGVVWIEEKVNDTKSGHAASKAGQSLTWKISDQASLEQRVEHLYTFDSDGQHLINASAVLTSTLTETLNLRLKVDNRYDSRPAGNTASNNLTVTVGFGLSL